MLLYDFDGGIINGIDTNVFGNLTFGAGETSGAPGDSGGPIFVNTNGQNLIAGVTSFGRSNLATDISPTFVASNGQIGGFGSFGDVGGDVRVSDPLNQNFIDLLVNHGRLLGDTNNDGTLDSNDIDFLFDQFGGVAEPWFDINLDGVVDLTDHENLVEEVFQTFRGDANLDGSVDIRDYSDLSNSYEKIGS